MSHSGANREAEMPAAVRPALALKRFPLELTQILPSSLPGLTRQSINFLNKTMDARVKPAHDDAIRAGNAL